jgi:uncharacterized membrane protein
LLYWLYQKSGIALMKLTSLIVWGAMLVSLLMDWVSIYSNSATVLTILANQGFITTIVSAVSSWLMYVLVNRDGSREVYGIGIGANFYKYAAAMFLFLSGILEINHQFQNRYPYTDLNSVYLMLYATAFILAFYLCTKKLAVLQQSWLVSAILISLCILVYLFVIPNVFNVQYITLQQHKLSGMHFIAHWLSAVFAGILFYQLALIFKGHLTGSQLKFGSWILTASIVLFLSLEVSLASNALFYSPANPLEHILTVYIKTGLPVLWGLSSFALMWLGMRNKSSTLRIISLTLFAVTLLKLFLFDIRNIPAAGKIAAFFCLGILLLIISFMYQKVKKIIVEDEKTNADK